LLNIGGTLRGIVEAVVERGQPLFADYQRALAGCVIRPARFTCGLQLRRQWKWLEARLQGVAFRFVC
jgi:hypothetical protein